jgi:hypothetical protein
MTTLVGSSDDDDPVRRAREAHMVDLAGIAVERDPFGVPRDPELAKAEKEGRLITGRFASIPDVEDLPVVEELHKLQAETEGVTIGDEVEFCGEKFKIGDRIGLMPLLKFAHVSSKGVTSDDMQGLAAMYAMIKDCIAPGEWERFEEHAINSQADEEDLFNVVSKTIEIITARPTRRRSGSSPGSSPTSESSKVSSTQTVARRAPEGLTPL